jgi:hypothetical protein
MGCWIPDNGCAVSGMTMQCQRDSSDCIYLRTRDFVEPASLSPPRLPAKKKTRLTAGFL